MFKNAFINNRAMREVYRLTGDDYSNIVVDDYDSKIIRALTHLSGLTLCNKKSLVDHLCHFPRVKRCFDEYLYCVIGIAILIDWFMDAKEREEVKPFFKQALLWGFLGVIIFFAADPFLWADPNQRLRESVFYHAGYSTSAAEVQSANFPVWQPFNWLVFSPSRWHPDVFAFSPDFLIAIFAVFGLSRLWKKERLYVLWLGIAMLFLLIWPTKWPQYILTLTVPLSLAWVRLRTLAWAWRTKPSSPQVCRVSRRSPLASR